SRAINVLSAARLFLFGARDVWFVIALPVFLRSQLGWDFRAVGGFLAAWIMAYGVIQSIAPLVTGKSVSSAPGRQTFIWASLLTGIPAIIALGISSGSSTATPVLIGGLLVFGAVFAINSSLHSYLIVRYAKSDGVS